MTGVAHEDDTQMMGDQVRFPATSWSLVVSSRNVEALGRLITIYWKPLYFFVRQHGHGNEAAKDIIQDFLTTLIERGSLSKADPQRGKFRTFLLVSLTNFLKDEAKAEGRAKRGGGRPLFSLDFVVGESEFQRDVGREESPEAVLDRAWARSLWQRCLSLLEGEPAHLEAFRLYLADMPYAAIAGKTGLSEGAAKVAVHRLKAQLREIVLEHLRETSGDGEHLSGELDEFMSLLSRSGGAGPA